MTLDLQPADRPTIYFIGLATGKSSIMKVFPAWANYLELGNCKLQGIDLKLHDDPEAYRKVISFIKSDPEFARSSRDHPPKMDLLKAAGDLFDHLEHYAQLMGEVSCISKRGGKLIGDAKDPITSNLTLDLFLPQKSLEQDGGRNPRARSRRFLYCFHLVSDGKKFARRIVRRRLLLPIEALHTWKKSERFTKRLIPVYSWNICIRPTPKIATRRSRV